MLFVTEVNLLFFSKNKTSVSSFYTLYYVLFERDPSHCTNEISVSDVNSAKNSLAIIYMCLKMHCLKYVIYFILFLFYSIFLYSCGPGVAI